MTWRTLLTLQSLALPALAQIKPGEWNGHKVDDAFPSLSITLYESGEAMLGYNTEEVEVMAQGTWERIKEAKFAGDALIRLDIEYVKRGEVVSHEGSIDPIYLSQSGDEAFVVKGVSVDETVIDISFPPNTRDTGTSKSLRVTADFFAKIVRRIEELKELLIKESDCLPKRLFCLRCPCGLFALQKPPVCAASGSFDRACDRAGQRAGAGSC